MTEAYVPVADYGKYYGEVVDQIGSVSQVCPLTINLCLILIGLGSREGKLMTNETWISWICVNCEKANRGIF